MAAGVLATPYIVGGQVEGTFHDQVAQANGLSQGYYEIAILEYERGFKSAEARTELTLNLQNWVPDQGLEPVSLRFKHAIDHGPLLTVNGKNRAGASFVTTTLDKDAMSAAAHMLIDNFMINPEQPVLSQDFLSFYGDMESHVQISGLKHQDMESQAKFEGIHASFNSNLTTGSVQGDIQIGGLNYTDLQNSFALAGGSIDVNLQQTEDEIWLGQQNLSLRQLNYEKDGTSLASVGEISVMGAISEHGGLLNSRSQMSVQGVETIFPVFSNGSLAFELNNVPVASVKQAQIIMQELQDAMPQNPADEAAMSAYGIVAMQRGMEVANLYLQKGVELKLAMDLANSEGQARADMQLAFDGVDGGNVIAAFASNSEQVVQAFSGAMDVAVDQSALSLLPVEQYIQMVLQSGFVQERGGQWVSKAELQSALLKVNDSIEIPVMSLLQGSATPTGAQ